jgi:hypothetical protein
MSQISRLKEVEIANGNLINADDLNAEFNQLVSESNNQDARLSGIENGTTALSAIRTNQLTEATPQEGIRAEGVQFHQGVVNAKPILAVISNVDATTDQITTASAHGLSTADTVGISVGAAGGSLPGGLSEDAFYFARVISPTVITLHPTINDANFGLNTVDITSTGSGTLHLVRTPATPKAGDIWVNQEGALQYRSLGGIYTVMDTFGRSFSRYESHTAAPVYTSPTTFTVAHVASRDWANAFNIICDTPITVDITTSSYNGILQFAVPGAISVTSGSNTVTVTGGSGGFTVGDVIVTNGGQARHVTAVDGSGNPTQVDSNWTTTETNVSFKYGGRCPNTWYYAYETISFGFTSIILSTRNFAAGQSIDFITSAFRQMPFAVRLDANTNILPFVVTSNGQHWEISYRDVDNFDPYRVLNNGSATTAFTSPGGGANVDCSSMIPPISRMANVRGILTFNGSGSQHTFIKSPESSSVNGLHILTTNSSGLSVANTAFWTPLDNQQRFAYRNSGSAQVTFIVLGYRVTEVK